MAPLLASSPLNWALIGVSLTVAFVIGKAFYNIFLHPLRSYPGPFLWRVFPIARYARLAHGDLPFYMKELHAKYGPVVRITPNELAFCDPQAWKDIYGHRSGGAPELPKYEYFYRAVDNIPRGIINAFRDEHAALRRQLSHGFSERSMQLQEPIIGSYVDLLINRLQEKCQGNAAGVDMREWLNWTTFDVIGDLAFGSAFGCLESSDYHPWVRLVANSVQQTAFMQIISGLGFRPITRALLNMKKMAITDNQKLVKEKLEQRIELGVERPDFLESLIKKKEAGEMSFMQIAANAATLIVAGSETTATLLSGALFLLTTNPDKLARLTKEVRTSFNNDDEITLTSVGKLSYMLACLNESLRAYPPVPTGMPRQSPKGGCFILGKFVPEGTVVAVWQYAINHHSEFWTEPNTFAPERFLGDPKFKSDQTDAMQPFSVGPRNCIGRNMAYAEMRLILARIIYNFDMEIAEDSRQWLATQKAYTLWKKPSLNIIMKPVVR
ncbi:cytochrome P450 ClCP1 [Annulohypoxylon maeteangense]|uniref:cytochrome P450 ClCP1 n=1 Tax=Annulohypoxylon maeteangense TaxID=1927788 RepID=UPI0020076203|nr:cytochrome P450 ClCP1 [Annulohypoxylon maeteangense]KAI0889737.1 cytochrome P450 ClCP1 [Annulohypoxylon maeteangense]